MRTLKLLIIPIFMLFAALLLTSCANDVVYTVYFDSNGGSEVSPIVINEGSLFIPPDMPTKEGYTFIGWYLEDVTFTTQVTSNMILDVPLDEEMTVYAKWSPSEYNINYVLNGGTNNLNNPTTFNSETVILVINDPEKEGYTFDGWYSDAACLTAFSFSTQSSEDIVLYAKWNINTYVFQYLDNDGTILLTANYEYGASLSGVIAPIASKEGYTFVEWSDDIPLTMPARDVHLSARYASIEYTVSFDTNEGSEMPDIIVSSETQVFNPGDPTKEGYVFGGWFLDSELTEPCSFPILIIEDITIYAKWEVPEYKVNYYIVGVDQIKNMPLSGGESILDISLGVENSAVITSEGRIFTWGANSEGQLGIGTKTTFNSVLTDITNSFGLIEEEKLIKIFLGSQASIALTSTGRIFTWGYSGNGQLGDGVDSIGRYTPGEITSQFDLDEGEMIVDISLGNVHSSAITSIGRIFTWGWNKSGQLGIGEVDNIKIYIPTDITNQFSLDEGDMITHVSLGDGHSSAMTSLGRIFTWGTDIQGQLGNGAIDNTTHTTPIEITSQFSLSGEEKIVDISISYYHSSAITSEGRVFTWGYNGNGNLGNGNEVNQNSPIDITTNFNLLNDEIIINISMIGYDHSSATTSEGRVFTWGHNNYSQLGIGTSDYDAHPIPIDITSEFSLLTGEQVIRTSLGTNHSSVITSTGRIFTWGRDNAGQLGDASLTNKATPVLITTVSSVKVFTESYEYEAQIIEYTPSKEGYALNGWYSDAELTMPYIFTTMPEHTLNLYGVWMID